MNVEIPKALAALSPSDRANLVREGLYEAVQARIRSLKADIVECEAHLHHFTEKYEVSFEQFETTMLADLDTHEAHEDYNDWFFWMEVLHNNRQLLSEIQENKGR
ncbi:MAG: hypothetical protein GY805_31890 [Chloroflexi bacterium]|nr:hypothetical protein [Chloroflexota bacterium]